MYAQESHAASRGRIPIYGRDKHEYRGLLYSKDWCLMLSSVLSETIVAANIWDFVALVPYVS